LLADIKAFKVEPRDGGVKGLGRIEILLKSMSARMRPGRDEA